jgi:uncharacterized membrane protein
MTFDRIRVGTTFFALGLIGLGIEHFVFGEFVTGRAPAWPASFPGGVWFARLTGIVFVGSGLLVLLGKKARSAAIAAAALIASWALLRHIPVLFASAFLSGAWTQAGKALVFTGGALAVAAAFSRGPTKSWIVLGRWCLGLFLLLAGVQHFLYVKFVASLIPTWFPGDAVFWTYFAGVALIAGGLGLLIPRTARLAAFLSGIMLFSWFWIVHIPRIGVGVSDQIAVFEALAFSGIAFVLSRRSSDRAS